MSQQKQLETGKTTVWNKWLTQGNAKLHVAKTLLETYSIKFTI